MTLQIVTLLGSISVLGGYFLIQHGIVKYNSWSYILPNLAGSILLGGVSVYLMLYGYIMLNLVWGVIGLHAVCKKIGPGYTNMPKIDAD